MLMTSAVYDDPQEGPTVLHFGVSFKAAGVNILDTWRVMGMRGTGFNDAMEVAGGGSFYRRAGLERAFRDIQAARFHPLQEKPQLRYSGRVALGLDVDG